MHREPSASALITGRACPSGTSSGRSPRRSGFSLIELMIVIVIIAILAGMLLSAVNNARVSARNAAAIQDIKGFEKAIADFKAQFGVEPPSFIILYEQGTAGTTPNWNADTTATWRDRARRQSRAALREMWPQFDFSQNVDINGDGDQTDVLILNGAECLAFFIGGLQQNNGAAGITPRGFSSNPATPFIGYTGNRIGPFNEFDPLRFVDMDATTDPNEKMFEYMDSIPGQTKPIQYFSSYGGQGYRPFGLATTTTSMMQAPDAADSTPEDDEVVYIGTVPSLRSVYNQSPGVLSGPTPAVPYKENGYQLISPGFDGDYGFGGFCNAQAGCQWSATSMDPVNRDQNLQYERDNITNFKGGTLN